MAIKEEQDRGDQLVAFVVTRKNGVSQPMTISVNLQMESERASGGGDLEVIQPWRPEASQIKGHDGGPMAGEGRSWDLHSGLPFPNPVRFPLYPHGQVFAQLPVRAKHALLHAGGGRGKELSMRKSLTSFLQSENFGDVIVPSSVLRLDVTVIQWSKGREGGDEDLS